MADALDAEMAMGATAEAVDTMLVEDEAEGMADDDEAECVEESGALAGAADV